MYVSFHYLQRLSRDVELKTIATYDFWLDDHSIPLDLRVSLHIFYVGRVEVRAHPDTPTEPIPPSYSMDLEFRISHRIIGPFTSVIQNRPNVLDSDVLIRDTHLFSPVFLGTSQGER